MESAKEDTGILALEDERLDPEMSDSGVLALAEGPPTTYGPQRRDDRRRDGKGQGTGGTAAGNVALDVNPF